MSGYDYNDASALVAVYSAALNAKGGSHIKGLLAVAKAARVEALEGAVATARNCEGESSSVYSNLDGELMDTREDRNS